jgi:hypothetical protein
LFENASAAFLGVVRRHLRAIRTALSAGAVDPALLIRIPGDGLGLRIPGLLGSG